jgi:plasmid stabilization system protein ParE
MRPYRFLAAARLEIEQAADWYEAESPGLGADFVDELAATLERARTLPHAGALVSGLRASAEVRRYLLRRFPYKLIAVVTASELVFVAVAHEAREPRYWRRRLAKARR